MSIEFKYQSYLDKYKNCPSDCEEKDIDPFRWVHETITENDFLPLIFIPDRDFRAIDKTDTICISYALSLYKDLKSAITRYLHFYNRQRTKENQDAYKTNKGTYVAKININKKHGVCKLFNKCFRNEPYSTYNYIGN